MIPETLLALRGEMYAAFGVYHQALAAYWGAINARADCRHSSTRN